MPYKTGKKIEVENPGRGTYPSYELAEFVPIEWGDWQYNYEEGSMTRYAKNDPGTYDIRMIPGYEKQWKLREERNWKELEEILKTNPYALGGQ